jgi:hypothetical protein
MTALGIMVSMIPTLASGVLPRKRKRGDIAAHLRYDATARPQRTAT